MNAERRRLAVVAAVLLVLVFSVVARGQSGVATNARLVKLDLPAAIERALTSNGELRRAARLLKRSALSVEAGESDFDLQIRPDGSAGATDTGESWRYGLTASKLFPWGSELEVSGRMNGEGGDSDSTRRTTVEISLQQPLLRSFGSLVQREHVVQANSAFEQARRSYELQKADQIVYVVGLYESIVRLQRQIDYDEAFRTRMEKLYRLTKARERQGRSTRVDSLRVELQRGQAQLRLESSRERQALAQRDLAESLGYRYDTEFVLEPAPLLALEEPDMSVAVGIALSNRLDYAQALQDYRDAQRSERITRRRLYPDLALVTRYQRYGDSSGDSGGGGLDQDYWFAGVGLASDLNRQQDRIAVKQSQINREAALDSVWISEQSVARDVQQQVASYRRARSELGIAERNVKLAGGRAELARRLFDMGRGDNFSVTDAEEAYTEAQTQLLDAQADASVSGYRLLRALGTLLEPPSELKPVPLEDVK